MAEERQVWIVTAGEYSGYQILAVFDDRALADAYAGIAGQGDAWWARSVDIEAWPLNPGAAGLRAGRPTWDVRVDAAGNVYWVEHDPTAADEVIADHGNVLVRMRVEAPDADHARKIAGERVARLKAEGAWPAEGR